MTRGGESRRVEIMPRLLNRIKCIRFPFPGTRIDALGVENHFACGLKRIPQTSCIDSMRLWIHLLVIVDTFVVGVGEGDYSL